MGKSMELGKTICASESDVKGVLNSLGWSKVLDAVRDAFVEEALGRTISPPKIIMSIEEHNNDYRVMPSFMRHHPNYVGTKIVCACPDNPKKYNMPFVVGTYILNDARNQNMLMVAGAHTSTAWRTAAATAVACESLIYPNFNGRVGIIGAGVQAAHHIPALSEVLKINEFLLNDVNHSNLVHLQFALREHGDDRIALACRREIFETCDLVITLTPTRDPHVFPEDIPNREMVIAGVGGDSAEKCEIAPEVLPLVDLYCDSIDQVSHTGTMMRAIKEKIIWPDQDGRFSSSLKSIGGLLVGKESYSQQNKVRLFLSTGVALEDLAINRLIYEELDRLEK